MYTSSRSPLFNPDKILSSLSDSLLPQEQVLGLFKTFDSVLITNMRLIGVRTIDKGINFSIPLNQIAKLTVLDKMEKSDSWYRNNPDLTILNEPLEIRISNVTKKDKEHFEDIFSAALGAAESWPDVPYFTKPLTEPELPPIDSNVPWEKIHKGLKKGIKEHVSEDAKPLFVIVAGSDEAIVALSHSCLVVKRGLVTGSIMGGQRVTSFFYSDITTIEYNGGAVQGRVNILTSSFGGMTDIDPDIGLLSDLASDSRFRPNSIEMDKVSYKNAKKYFDALNDLIAKSKGATGHMVEPKDKSSIADEIGKLADLHQKGLIDDTEFKELKAKLIQE